MSRYNKNKGDWGEELAASYLKEHGFTILERQFRSRFGEIDIIAYKENTFHFVEVKTRSNRQFGGPFEAINHNKMNHIMKTAQYYLLINNHPEYEISIDAFGISGEEVSFIENVRI